MKATVGCGVGRNLRCRRGSVKGAAPPKAVLHAACLQTARLLRAPRLSLCLSDCSTTVIVVVVVVVLGLLLHSHNGAARRGEGKRGGRREGGRGSLAERRVAPFSNPSLD